jgi:formaldehyde-activating enzyme involved in methanogenesis
LKQRNAIKNGAASATWGPLAYDVTFAMIDSVADILLTMERADDIRLGR